MQSNMRAAIINPYLDSLGGGERYSMAVATTLRDLGYSVDVEWKDIKIIAKLEKRFGISLNDVNFIPSTRRGEGYDMCFWVSDGSIPMLQARKNLLHFQVPFHDVGGGSLLNRMKMFRINKVICNSDFTKNVVDKEFRVNSAVLYPPVSVEKFRPRRKEKYIIYVGRFSQLKQSKNQHMLIEAFKRLYKSGFSEWKLILAGGSELGAGEYLIQLKRSVGDYPIEIIESSSFTQIVDLYGKAKIFWSAAGAGIDERKEPEKVEHFGISLVEAMASGCIPLVYGSGGYKEIIEDGKEGYLWETIQELIKKTKSVINTPSIAREISKSAVVKSKRYSYERFKKGLTDIISHPSKH